MDRVWVRPAFVDNDSGRAHTAGVEIRVLGDLTIDGGRLSPKERSLLAALVLRAGSVITPPELADAVWSEEPPNTWPKQVQAFVVRIRRASGSSSVATTRGGYRLRVDPDSIDAVRYRAAHRRRRAPTVRTATRCGPSTCSSELPHSGAGCRTRTSASGRLRLRKRSDSRRSGSPPKRTCRLHGSSAASTGPSSRTRSAWSGPIPSGNGGGRFSSRRSTAADGRPTPSPHCGAHASGWPTNSASNPAQNSSRSSPRSCTRTPRSTRHRSRSSRAADCPYRGLQPFGTDDAEEFFGRDADIRAALARLAGSPFLAVSGASGCGKSSLVLAGLVPALRARGDTVVVLGSGATPIAPAPRRAVRSRSRRRHRHRPVRGTVPFRSPGCARRGVLGADRGRPSQRDSE